MMSYYLATSCAKIRRTLQDQAPNQNAYCANALFAAARTPRYFPVPYFPVPGFAGGKMWDRKLT
ncbi:MAG: hypothetical protein MOB07_01615 [Acidobacteria bacterium]|nr:hypothetical protein [Acidobacteriota bacterium]